MPGDSFVRSLGIIPVVLLLGGCRAHFGGPMAGTRSWSAGSVLLEVPLVRQRESNRCALASAGMVTGYYGLEFSTATLAALDGAARGGGVTGEELKRAFEASGYHAPVFPGTLDREVTGLFRQLDRGWPLIVMLGDPRVSGHYVVVVGYDRKERELAFLDPYRGPVVAGLPEFDQAWEQARRFTLLAVPAVVGDSVREIGGQP